ncbi:MAG: hypothetical protein ACE5ID_05840, partial [Acidobacteriota bacterium]
MSRAVGLTAMAMAAFFVSFGVGAQMKHEMKKPPMVTLSGKLIDMTCSAKGKALMNSWGNAENNTHMT